MALSTSPGEIRDPAASAGSLLFPFDALIPASAPAGWGQGPSLSLDFCLEQEEWDQTARGDNVRFNFQAWRQHGFPKGGDNAGGKFPGGPPWAGRMADEPWHCSLTPQEQERESSPCRAFHLLPGPVWPEDSKSYPGLVPFITTLYFRVTKQKGPTRIRVQNLKWKVCTLKVQENEGKTVGSCKPSALSAQPLMDLPRHH